MKYVVFTYSGYGLPIAKKLADEGREVVVAQIEDSKSIILDLQKNAAVPSPEHEARRMALYDGILPKESVEKVMKRLRKEKAPDEWFLFFDLNHLFRYAEELRDRGFHGNFPTENDFCYEIDRELAKEFVDQQYKLLSVGAKHRFAKASEAKKFLKSSEDMWVLKGLDEDARTVVPDVDDQDLAHGQIVDALDRHRDEYEAAGFILELLIPNAMELTPGKVYYNGEPVYTCLCIENKPMGAGNLGPMTDCAQDIVFRTEDTDRINEIAFPPIVDEMAKLHTGLFYWDASLYVDPRNGRTYFGEFCANRPGYNSLYTEISLCGSASKYFESVIAGKNPHPENAVAASVRIFNYHLDGDGQPMAERAVQYKPRIEKDLWLWDVRSRKQRLESCGYVDTIGVATGKGRSLSEATKKAYTAAEEFSFEGAYYRPAFDMLSKEYKASIPNRLNYGLQRGLYKVGFAVE